MSNIHVKSAVSRLQEWDKALYKEVIDLSIPATQDSKDKIVFAHDVDIFLKELSDASLEVTDIDDRSWLTNTAAKWQKLLSTLNIPRLVELHDPKRPLQPPPSPSIYFVDEEITEIIKRKANALSRERLSERANVL